MKEYNLMINYFLIIDRMRGASFGELAKIYKLDSSNISKRIRGVLNCHQNRARKKAAHDKAANEQQGEFVHISIANEII